MAPDLGAGHSDPDDVRALLQALYARRAGALSRGAVQAALAVAHDGFVASTPGGAELSRQQVEARLWTSFGRAGFVARVWTEVRAVEVFDDRASAQVREVAIWTSADPLDATRQVETFEERELVDTWHRQGRSWRLTHSGQLLPTSEGSLEPEEPGLDSPRLQVLAHPLADGDAEALNAFWAERLGASPMVEVVEGDDAHRWVTFLWQGDAQTEAVELVGGLPQPACKPLRLLASTNVWYRTEKMPVTSRADYAFTVHGPVTEPAVRGAVTSRPDPFARDRLEWSSWFELPGAPPQPYITERPGITRGRTTRERIHSRHLDEDRTWSVHVPAGFDPADPRAGLVVVFDGEAYGGEPDAAIPTPLIVDNLVAEGRIPPSVVVLIDGMDRRSRDLTCHPPFFRFVAEELVPEVRRCVGLPPNPARTVAVGSSYGGLAAAYCGLRHADVFGNVLSQSGSFWGGPGCEAHESAPHEYRTGWVMDALSAGPRLPLRFWLEVGRFEPDIQVLSNRHVRSVLELRGYPHTYSEFDGGHSYSCWRGSLADGLIALLGS